MAFKGLFEVPKDRLVALTDGVYAIAITILVLELTVPAVTNVTTHAQMIEYFKGYLLPAITMYLISFYLVATFWENTLILFEFDEINNQVKSVSLAALAFVSLIPFCTGFLFEFWEFREVNLLFSGVILIVSLLYLILFYVVFKREIKSYIKEYDFSVHHLLEKIYRNKEDKTMKDKYTHFRESFFDTLFRIFYIIISPVLISIIAIIVAFIEPHYCIYVFILLLIFRIIIRLRHRGRFNAEKLDFDELTEEEQKMYKFIENLNE